jgi:hypothetical protein
VTTHEALKRLRKLLIEFLNCARYAERCCEGVVLTLGDLLGQDIHAELFFFEIADSQQNRAMPQQRRKFFEHDLSPLLWIEE